MYATAYNPSDVPVVIDGEGRTIGGREWGTVETTDDVAAEALEASRLIVMDRPKGDLSPGAGAAFDRTDEVGKRATKLDKLTKARLVKLADESGLQIDPDNPPHKPDLVARLARRTRVEVPSASSTSSADTDTETEEA